MNNKYLRRSWVMSDLLNVTNPVMIEIVNGNVPTIPNVVHYNQSGP